MAPSWSTSKRSNVVTVTPLVGAATGATPNCGQRRAPRRWCLRAGRWPGHRGRRVVPDAARGRRAIVGGFHPPGEQQDDLEEDRRRRARWTSRCNRRTSPVAHRPHHPAGASPGIPIGAATRRRINEITIAMKAGRPSALRLVLSRREDNQDGSDNELAILRRRKAFQGRHPRRRRRHRRRPGKAEAAVIEPTFPGLGDAAEAAPDRGRRGRNGEIPARRPGTCRRCRRRGARRLAAAPARRRSASERGDSVAPVQAAAADLMADEGGEDDLRRERQIGQTARAYCAPP